MPYTHNFKVTVRNYECDAYRRVHPAVLLGYMQESAIAASSAVGYSPTRYDEIGLVWLAYEHDLHILRPITREDSLVINTWVADMRRVRSLRRYEMYCEGQVVAHASTDWVLIDRRRNSPTTVPNDMVEAYSQGEPPTDPLPRHGVQVPDVPAHAFHVRRRVEVRDVDMAAHVNNAVYLYYAADAEEQALRAAGWAQSRFEEAGWLVTPSRHTVAYKMPALIGDTLDVYTWADQITPEGGLRYTVIKRDDKVLTQVRTEWLCTDINTGEAVPTPDGFIA